VLGGRVLATVASAGHPPPLLVRPSGVVVPTAVSGPLLGAFTQGAWANETVPVDTGESLVLYTDGVTDAVGAQERFGDGRLTRLLAATAGSSADAIAEQVDRAVADFQIGDQRDDVALLVLQASGGATGAAGEPAVIGELRGE
jgi:serine phosphatase RsbU (regulator of sigma subunit)